MGTKQIISQSEGEECHQESNIPNSNDHSRTLRKVEEDSKHSVLPWCQSLRFFRNCSRAMFTDSSVLFITLSIACLYFGYVQAVAECMSGNKLKCFECNSHKNPECGDPFNWTTLPPWKLCDGCCVKMVQGIGTPGYRVTRTCISEIEINMFMVDHVCMSQSNRKGTLCFCEGDRCNNANHYRTETTSFFSNIYFVVSIFTLIIQASFNCVLL